MQLSPGTRVGPFEIVEAIGAGGMGEVYRARDTALDRDVAIKVLPDVFAADPDRLARFEREAKTLAALNHPNIAHIHGLETGPAGAGRYAPALVMELVEGEDLSQRLARGPVPLDEAIPIARQIADALEAAHEQGVIHRDLKPANVKVRADGMVKVLDFGLAKALASSTSDPNVGRTAVMNSPTFASPAMTQMGMIIGTAAYMSPEQARGKPADRRADIWAFGCVLFEMLSGRRPFEGDDVSLILAAVLKQNVDFTALPADTPTSIRRLLRRCLEKDPRKRLSAIGDARLELDDEPPGEPVLPAIASRWHVRVIWGAAGALVAAAAVIAGLPSRSQSVGAPRVVRSQITFPDTPLLLLTERALALAPDASELIFSSARLNEPSHLYRRSLADETVTLIPGTEGATSPFFSPDGQWLAFNQDRRLKKIPAGGGAPNDYGSSHQGGSFGPDGTLIFNTGHGAGLVRVRGNGTTPEVLTTVNRAAGEAGHHWPHVLPDGRYALYTAELDGEPYSEARIMLLSLETGQSQLLIDGGSDARYIPTGHIVYWHSGAIWSVPFDLSSRRLGGAAVVVLPDVMLAEANGHAHFAVAADGTVAYLSGADPNGERGVMLVDRTGTARPVTTERKAYRDVRVSPEGTRLGMNVIAANDSLWTLDLDRGAPTRITFEAENSGPVWSPDGTGFAFTRNFGGEPAQLHLVPSDGSGTPRLIRPSDRPEFADSWSRTGNLLAFTREESATGSDIWVMPMEANAKALPWLATRFDESAAHFSPDGRWIAYVSNQSGRFEVYVRSYPGGAHNRQVSFEGGTDPRWRGDGRELFYRHQDWVLVSDVTTAGGVLRFSPARVLFKGQYLIESWDVLPNGQGFVFVKDFARPRTAVTLVQHWFEEMKRRK